MNPTPSTHQIKSARAFRPTGEMEGTRLYAAIESEVNLLVLPFFALWDKDASKRARTEYKTLIDRGNERIEFTWTVISNSEFGYPGPFDRAIHKAVEQIISELPTPIHNPISLGPLQNLYKKTGVKESGETQFKKTKEAFRRIAATSIRLEEVFSGKEKQEWIEDTFHLYDRVILKGKKLPDGEIADTNYLYLSSWYLDNINARYDRPMDWDYHSSLKTPVAQRLYELLRIKLHSVVMREDAYLSCKYSTLCDLLPAVRQKSLSSAKRVLDPPHERLKMTGFLVDWSWEELIQADKEEDLLIRYYPGKRAKEEIERFGSAEQLEFELPIPREKEAESPIDESGIAQKQRDAMEGSLRERKERWLRHREKLIKKDISDWDNTPPEVRVKGILDFWIVGQKINGPAPTSYQVEVKKQELIDNLPDTDEGKWEYMARNYPEEPPSDFK